MADQDDIHLHRYDQYTNPFRQQTLSCSKAQEHQRAGDGTFQDSPSGTNHSSSNTWQATSLARVQHQQLHLLGIFR